MSSKRLKRILNEIKELNDSKEILEKSGIYIHINEENMSKIYALLIGPEKTPYEKGYYLFKFEYPENYPMEPPKAEFFTQGFLKNTSNKNFPIRFNPNLYTDGKVCLSMLNTWNGPGWVPTNTISNVLVAIQGLVLTEQPLKNEPGFETALNSVLIKYNNIIEYANLKIGVIKMLKETPLLFEPFKIVMINLFKKNIEYFRNFILKQNETFNNVIISFPAYTYNGSQSKILVDYMSTLDEFEKLYEEYMSIEVLNNNINNIKI
jgi:ubiquitin-protein ligase